MKQVHPYEQVPLTEDEKDLLFTVYDSRRRLLFVVYTILMSVALGYSYWGVEHQMTRSVFSGFHHVTFHKWGNNEDAQLVSKFGMWMINLAVLESVIMGTGVFFLVKRVLPFRRDIKSGLKERIPYVIIRKEYFPLTNQFYVGFNDPNYLHHEIDEGTYNSCKEGDIMYIYRAIKSKFIFEENGRFSIM